MEKFMGRHGFVNVGVLFLISVLVLTVAAQPVGLTLENVQAWYWTSHTYVNSVAGADIDGDGTLEIITGGYYRASGRTVAQLCVWNGATLALENVTAWYWTAETIIASVALSNVDGDGQTELITGGNHYDDTRDVAQLCVWAVPS